MKDVEHRHQYVWLLVLSAMLMLVGVVMLSRVYDQYPRAILENEDTHLLELAQSVDQNIENYLQRFGQDLSYVTQRRGFLEAENIWRETGETGELLFRMSENLAVQEDLIYAVLAIQDGEVFLSTDGRTDYYFPSKAGTRGEISMRPCIDADGQIYLAFVRAADERLSYATVMKLADFYWEVGGNLSMDRDCAVMLLDAGGRTLLHIEGDAVQARPVHTGQAFPNRAELEFLLEAHEAEAVTTASREACYTGKGDHTSRVTVLPYSATENRAFSIIVSSNHDKVMQPLRTAAIRLMAYSGMVLMGILLLAAMFLQSNRRNEQNLRQLSVLQQKNAEMERLNRQTQELAHHQRLQLMGTLTSGIAHEFNNLLTPIMGYSLLTLEKLSPDGDELYDNILEIYNASRKAKTIISRLSTLSRKNGNEKQTLIDPAELARQVLSVAAPAQPETVTASLTLDCEGARLLGNETLLSQMLLNLVLNAFQAMEPSGGQLTLTVRRAGERVCFTVSDTGPGIPDDVLPRIFEPFFTTKETGKGTGLGLAIVQQAVETHDGEIHVETKPGEGTSISVLLPLAADPAAE